ncbi:D-alanyl-D-alanine carboxypeptidase/D-alanyl-D-alanine-endopeptidase (penicillin-binding protein 4) [Streptomyces sp. TLI_235]|nr:D-alanyl-D-alanine carboxypeptidase/D-alanyl-D-alanine-endopeptidase [Streptomyces sp. TLI_235]PBC78331.1 D-alanyl-D-alanine carboxypeptidase/D-alanyl-D-alanine-endopeptidase (penicillin-binding protein 4) [Streptomyces sp. TLI_235]
MNARARVWRGRRAVAAGAAATVLAVAGPLTVPTAAADPGPAAGRQDRHRSGDGADGARRGGGGDDRTDKKNDAGPGQGTARRPRSVPVKGPVLAAVADAAGVPTGEGIQRSLGAAVHDGALGTLNWAVADAATGRLLLGSGENTPATPASTTKLATSVAALSLIPPTTRISTTVVRGSSPGSITLVGGGDPTLTVLPADQIRVGGQPVDADTAPASLADLAARTAAALKAAGTTTVRLGYDTSLYTGPLLHPEHDAMNIAAVTPLMVDEGRVDPKSPDEAPARVYDPAGQAAAAFADRLRAEGVTVDGTPAQTTAPAGAAVLAAVRSPTVPRLVERLLTTSDNTLAEAVARQVAIAAHRPASFEGASAATLQALTALGVPTAGVALADGSGLSKTNLIPPITLTELLARAAASDHPELRPVLTGLPVAGFTGTLVNRYGARSGAAEAAGIVRAKTGTLSGVVTLAGTVVDADGRVLVFALMSRSGAGDARAAVDRIVARIAACGCR